MDVVSLGLAKADATRRFSGRPATLTAKLARGKEPAVLQILGDSTGNDTNEWVQLTASWLAQQYPLYTVRHILWSDTNQSYDAPTVVSTGTAPTPAAVSDTYTAADGTAVTTNSLTTSGHAYTIVGGTLAVNGGKLTTAVGASYFLIAAPRRDYTLTASVTLVTGGIIRVFLRHADTANHMLLEIGLGTLKLYERIGGVLTTIGTGSNPALTTGQTVPLTVTVSGRTVTATLGSGSLTANIPAYEQAWLLSPTSCGIYFTGTLTGLGVDNFTVTPAALTLDIYNASTPGMAANYSQARLALQMPVAPDLTVISYGHNESYQDIRTPTISLIRAVLDLHPKTQLAITAQNPRATSNVGYVDGLIKNQTLTALAASEGLGLIDVFTRFNDNPTYAADWLLPDGLHPNSAGSLIWADEVQRWLLRTRTAQATTQRPARVWSPASQLLAVESTPTPGALSGIPGLAFDPTTQQAAATVIDVPSNWLAFNIWLLAVTPTNSGLTGSTNTVSWEVTWGGLGFDTTATYAPPSTAVLGQAVATINMNLNNTGSPSIYTARAVTAAAAASRPLAIQVRRRAADAGDTYAQAANLIGVLIERAA